MKKYENVINFADAKLKLKIQDNDRDAILKIVIEPEIEAVIKCAGLDSDAFMINRQSLEEFFDRPVTYKDENDVFGYVYCDCRTQNNIYRAECAVTFDHDDVISETNLYMLPDYLHGNNEWLYFENGNWHQGPGRDYFSLIDLLKVKLSEVEP